MCLVYDGGGNGYINDGDGGDGYINDGDVGDNDSSGDNTVIMKSSVPTYNELLLHHFLNVVVFLHYPTVP